MYQSNFFVLGLSAVLALACSSKNNSGSGAPLPKGSDSSKPAPTAAPTAPPEPTPVQGAAPSQNLDLSLDAEPNADFVRQCNAAEAQLSPQSPLVQSLVLLIRIENNFPATTSCSEIWNALKYRRQLTISNNDMAVGSLAAERNGINMQIADLALLNVLGNLQNLTIVNTRVPELNSVGKLVRLKTLVAYGQSISDTLFLSPLTDLQSLVLGSVNAPYLQGWRGLGQLKKLVLQQNSFESLDGWNLPADGNAIPLRLLLSAKLDQNKLKRIDGIENAPNLKTLSVAQNALTSLGSIKTLTELTNLNVRANSIDTLADIGLLSQLTVLDVSQNPLTNLKDFTSVQPLKKLISLNAENISNLDLAGIENLPNLQRLSLAGTEAQSLQPLSALIGLSELSLARTKLRDLNHLPTVSSLTRLDISGNKDITDFIPLSRFALTDLSVQGIPIPDSASLATLFKTSTFVKLHSVDLRDTGMNDLSFIADFARAKLQSLRPSSDCDIFQYRELNIILAPASAAFSSCSSVAEKVGKYRCIRYDPTGLTPPQTESNPIVRCLALENTATGSDLWSEN